MTLLSCITKKNMRNCEIKEILKVTVKSSDLYYMNVRFSHCKFKEYRKILIKNEMTNRFPLVKNKTIYVDEYLGKLYNEYKYEITIK